MFTRKKFVGAPINKILFWHHEKAQNCTRYCKVRWRKRHASWWIKLLNLEAKLFLEYVSRPKMSGPGLTQQVLFMKPKSHVYTSH